MIITNVRGCTGTSCNRRALAEDGVAFDTQVSTNTTAEAEALNVEIKGGNSTEEALVLAEFRAEIEVVKADPAYDDVPPNYVVPAALELATQQGEVTLETVAPTPSPLPAETSDDDGISVSVVAGAAAGVALLAGVALWHRGRARRAATTKTERVDSLPELHEVYPSASMTKRESGAELEKASVL